MSILKPEIYVICEMAHQFGMEHGRWFNANQKPSSLYRAVRRLMASSPVCPDYEGYMICTDRGFGDVRLWEYEELDLETASKIARFIVKKGELGVALVNYFSNIDKAKRALQEDYYGAFDSKEDFAIYLNNFPDFDELMVCYFDYQRYTRHIFAGNFFALEVAGKTHVFDNRANR